MPELDLGEWKEAPDWHDSLAVSVAMLYPNDPASQEEYRVRFEAHVTWLSVPNNNEAVDKHLAQVLAPIGGFRSLSDGPSYADIELRANRQIIRGRTAGEVLANIMRLQKYGYDSSIHKAVKAMKTFFTKRERLKVEPRLPGKYPTSRSAIMSAWSEFRPVAHLWAAWITNGRPYSNFAPYHPANLPHLLATANLFLEFGGNHYPTRGKAPTLPPVETLKIRPNFPLPELEKMNILPLTDDRVEAAGIKIKK